MAWPKIIHLSAIINGILMRGSIAVGSWADIKKIMGSFERAEMDIEQPNEEKKS